VSDIEECRIQHLGSIDGTQIAVQTVSERSLDKVNPGQRILVQQSENGRHLVGMLGLEPTRLEGIEVEGARYWSVPHDARVDDLLRTIGEILTAVRYLHPAFVQLRLSLEQETRGSNQKDT